MARPPRSDAPPDAPDDLLVEFDPLPPSKATPGAEEIYEVDHAPKGRATPSPEPVLERMNAARSTEAPPEAVPVTELRASLSGRHRETSAEPRRTTRRGTSPLLLVFGGVLVAGCAGTIGLLGLGLLFTGVKPKPVVEDTPIEAPPEFGSVPVERGFRRGDEEPGPVRRPSEPTP